jgi:parallel beta-helix repeat protein
MAKTEIRGGQIKDTSVQRSDLDVSTTGEAVVRRIVAGSGITLGSTGIDTGTGDVTINSSAGGGDMYLGTAQTVTAAKIFNAGTLLDKGTQVFNVKAYGATGDGSTDDSTNIQSAITAAQAVGGTVFFPTGTYIIGTTLTISGNNVTLMGCGWSSVLKVKDSTNIYAITLDAAASRKYNVFRNFKIDGNRTNNLTAGGGITGTAAVCTFTGIWITNCRDKQIALSGTASIRGYNNWIDRCIFDTNTPYGIHMTYNDENIISNNIFSDFTTTAIYDNSGLNNIHHNSFVGFNSTTTGKMIHMTGISSGIVDSNVFDGPHEEAIYADASGVIISNNRVVKVAGGDTTNPAIKVLNGSRNIVMGNNVIGGAYYTYALEESSSTYTQVSGNYFEPGTTSDVNYTSTTIVNNGIIIAVDNRNGSASAGLFKNNTTYAHAGTQLVDIQMLNATDTSKALRIKNAGTGNSLSIEDGSGNPKFSVTQGGAMTTVSQYSSTRYAASTTINWNNGNVQSLTLANGGNTLTFSNPQSGGRYLIELKQPASGAAGTVTFPSTVKWSGGTAPTLTTTNGQTDIITLYYNGTNYAASSLLNLAL